MAHSLWLFSEKTIFVSSFFEPFTDGGACDAPIFFDGIPFNQYLIMSAPCGLINRGGSLFAPQLKQLRSTAQEIWGLGPYFEAFVVALLESEEFQLSS